MRQNVRTELGTKNREISNDIEASVLRTVVRLLWTSQLDTRLDVQRIGDLWVWVAVDGLAVRYGMVPAKVGKREQTFQAACKYANATTFPDPVEFWGWAEVENVGHAWTFGDCCYA